MKRLLNIVLFYVCLQAPVFAAPLAVKVPTQFKVSRTIGAMAVNIDASDKTLTDARINVGSKMITGVQYEWFVYPKGSPRSKARTGSSFTKGADFKMFAADRDVLRPNAEGVPFPKPGVTYVVEMELTIFETDVPARMWNFTDIKNYKVLWTRTLKQVVGKDLLKN